MAERLSSWRVQAKEEFTKKLDQLEKVDPKYFEMRKEQLILPEPAPLPPLDALDKLQAPEVPTIQK
jgi:hypothetical protein